MRLTNQAISAHLNVVGFVSANRKEDNQFVTENFWNICFCCRFMKAKCMVWLAVGLGFVRIATNFSIVPMSPTTDML